MAKFRPMLAVNATESDVQYPVIVTPKVDGIRGVVLNGKLRSRTLERFPNKFAEQRFSRPELEGLDGELAIGPPTAQDLCRRTGGALSSPDGEPDVTFYVFDHFGWPNEAYIDRRPRFSVDPQHVEVLPSMLVENRQELLAYEKEMLKQGYEGLILRSPTGKYKYGRSTLKEQGM